MTFLHLHRPQEQSPFGTVEDVADLYCFAHRRCTEQPILNFCDLYPDSQDNGTVPTAPPVSPGSNQGVSLAILYRYYELCFIFPCRRKVRRESLVILL